MSSIPNNGCHHLVAGDKRLDPFWDGLWSTGSSARWASRNLVEHQANAGLIRYPETLLNLSEDEAIDKFLGSGPLRRRLEVLAAVGAWRTVSSGQLAAIVGYPVLERKCAITDVAFAARLIDFGVFDNGFSTSHHGSNLRLFRPSRTEVLAKRVMPNLTAAERLIVAGGRNYLTGGQYDRHNLLSTELGLRLAEYTPVAAVVGETFSTADDYVGRGIGKARFDYTKRVVADMTAYRSDGMAIAVELTASMGKDFPRKVETWAKVMSSSSFATNGLVVVFVGAPPFDRAHDKGYFFYQMKKAIRRVATRYPGVASRLGAVMWEEWFPAARVATEEFLSMTVYHPLATGSWGRTSLLDPFEYPFDPLYPDRALGMISNLRLLGHVPHWLREAAPDIDIHAALMHQYLPLPVSEPEDERGRANFLPGCFPASFANPKVPIRLSTLTANEMSQR